MPDQNDPTARGGGGTSVGGGAIGGGGGGDQGGGGAVRIDAARARALAAPNTAPAFEFEKNDESENFNLRPRADLPISTARFRRISAKSPRASTKRETSSSYSKRKRPLEPGPMTNS
jgi:hypothetical protein